MNRTSRWRRAQRQRLRLTRETLPLAWRQDADEVIAGRLVKHVPELRQQRFAFYWPMPGEPDLRAAAAHWVAAGAKAALPDTFPRQPLTFRPWTPDCPMRAGVWDIPVPDTMETVEPSVLLMPCLGYDIEGYRLGHGGGYYDRTLAAMRPRPLAIGVGYSHAVLPTIWPQAHDIPMDAVVTEKAFIWHCGFR